MKHRIRRFFKVLGYPIHFVVYIVLNILSQLKEDRRGVARSEFIIAGVISMTFLSVYQFAFQSYVLNYVGDSGIGSLFLGNFSVWLFSVFVTFILLRQIKKRRQHE